MIYTITLNPAVDVVLSSPNIQSGKLNRIENEVYIPGGKGINISRVLHRLGYRTIATGFLGGFTGQFIREALAAEGIESLFVDIAENTRINVKLQHEQETDLNTRGPVVEQEAFNTLIEYLSGHVTEEDTVFLSGSNAVGLDSHAFQKIATLCLHNQAKFVLDTNNSLLTESLAYKPFVIKPNVDELSDLFEVKITQDQEIIDYAMKLQKRGAKNVIVSQGSKGAILLTETGEIFKSHAPEGKLISSVGSGDSMLAVFVAKYNEKGDYRQALHHGTAAGSATAFSVGLAEADIIHKLLTEVKVEQIQ